jgi:hypothetical protein
VSDCLLCVSTEQISDLDLELDFRFTYPIYSSYHLFNTNDCSQLLYYTKVPGQTSGPELSTLIYRANFEHEYSVLQYELFHHDYKKYDQIVFPNSKLQTTLNLHTYLHILFSIIKDLDLYIRSTGCRRF